ncbi:MAG TPA: NAD(P)-dependent alcohol dehydrogenase [Actinomycetota bacterium]|nr:NAD(P)-dependent alcohol dehydrogenase [Actinomycetota bacterium]
MTIQKNSDRMRAVIYERYGPPEVLRLEDVERPVHKDHEVLIKVHASTVNRTDTGLRSAEYFISRFFTGLVRPRRRIPGTEFAGEVEAVGPSVSEFRVGDHVFGVSASTAGAHAEYLVLPESAPMAHKPGGITFEEAAAMPDGVILALSYLKRVDLQTKGKLLIYGASGSIGTAAVQLAKHFGADVTAVCNTKNVELVASLGGDRVLDYTKEDFTNDGEAYDFIFDAVGKLSFKRCKESLNPGGIYGSTDLGPYSQNPFLALWTARIGDKKVLFPIPRYRKEDVLFLKELIEAGKYRAVIDRRYPMEDVVEANRYVETGQKTGNVVLIISPS